MLENLFYLSMIAIPFNDFNGTSALGEMKHELSAYLFLITFALFTYQNVTQKINPGHAYAVQKPYLLPKIMLALFGLILLSFLFNFFGILEADFRGRIGIVKFFTSTLVVGYGFAVAYLTYAIAGRRDWSKLILEPQMIAVSICAGVAFFEYFSWHGGPTAGIYDILAKFVHSGSEASVHKGFLGGMFGWGHTEGRIRATAFEPPAFANYCGFAWPWIFAACLVFKGKKRIFSIFLFMALCLLIVLSASRTGVLLMLGSLAILLVLRFVYLPPTLASRTLRHASVFMMICTVIIALGFAWYHSDDMVKAVIGGDSVSNISRFSSNVAAFNMFLENPILGNGFGQYGFHASKYMPSWGYYSWEIRSWFTDPMVVWPPVFSMYARLAAETGMIGIIVWVSIWLYLIHKIAQVTLAFQKISGELMVYSYPLILSCFCVLFSGIPSDSLRNPMIWVTMGLSCYFINELQQRIKASRAAAEHASISFDARQAAFSNSL